MLPIAALMWSLTAVTAPSVGAPSVAVRVYQPFGDAHASATVEATVERIFAKAGIAVRWIDCSLPGPQWPAASPCARPPAPGEVILRLLDRPAAGRGPCSHGFALVPSDRRMGVFATVFTDGLDPVRVSTIASPTQLLSHFTAHELGHLLLGEGHSPEGLMRAEWSARDLDRAARGQLAFTAAQGERMRRNLAALDRPARSAAGAP